MQNSTRKWLDHRSRTPLPTRERTDRRQPPRHHPAQHRTQRLSTPTLQLHRPIRPIHHHRPHKKINAADTRATEALELAESLDDSRGEPDGLATLDGYGHLDPAQIDPDTIGVRVFNGFVEGATIEQVGINGTPGFSSIVYDTRARKFLLQAG